jgi:hypothetical protein
MGQIQTKSDHTGVTKEIGPVEIGFSAKAISATGRLPSNVVDVAGYSTFVLAMVTTGGTDVGRAELEFTGYAQDGVTVLLPRTVVLGVATDITLAVAVPSVIVWGGGLTATSAGVGTIAAAAVGADLFRGIPKIKFELNVTVLDAAATVSMLLNMLK